MGNASPNSCKCCGDEYDEYYAPGFCSEGCYYEDKGDTALNLVRHDHRFCGSCGGVLKEIEEPDSDWVDRSKSREQYALNTGGIYHDGVFDITRCPDQQRTQTESVVGFQYRTTEAVTVVKEFEGPDRYSRLRQTGTGCVCGCVDTRNTSDVLRECNPTRVLANYVRAFRLLEREGQLDQRIDKELFFETYRDTRDFDIALGRALHG